MDKPDALRLAGYWVAKNDQGEYLYSSLRFREETAAELRRLHDVEKAYQSACGIIDEQDKRLVELEKQHPKRYAAAIAATRREWQELTDEEINDGRDQLLTEDLCYLSFRRGVYFAEAKLKEKNHG
mgnify:CR=1 FL=1|jgi:2-oxo-4-hydroxy-4-carboxy--5-ureidoimidazoline (OHCU) decarboxylase